MQMSYDQKKALPMITYSKRGGFSRDQLESDEYKDEVHRIYIENVHKGLDMMVLNKVAFELGIQKKASDLSYIMKNVFECFVKRDALVIQINPLVLTKNNKLCAANCKIEIDDSANFRQ